MKHISLLTLTAVLLLAPLAALHAADAPSLLSLVNEMELTDVATCFQWLPMGLHGFRAVLWHQGESDANQKDATRTLWGQLYREYLAKLIRESRREIGWDAPWFVAQVSYHVSGDETSSEIRAAQASLWKDGIAQEGPTAMR